MVGKENLEKKLTDKNMKFIKAKGTDTLIVSMLLSLILSSKNKSELDNNGRTIIVSPKGFIGKANTKIAVFRDEITEKKTILVADKYTLQAKDLTEFGEDGKMVASKYWAELHRKFEGVSNIIITNLAPFVSTQIIPKEELIKKYRGTISLFKRYADLNKKNIIIVENEDNPINALGSLLDKNNQFEIAIESNNVYIKDTSDGKDDKVLLRPDSLENLLNSNPDLQVKDVISSVKRVTLGAISGGSIRSLPPCPTGYAKLDDRLDGGLELGQVLSLVSDNEDIPTHFTLQMALQLPPYYKSLIINLSMNPRRLKEILDVKRNDNQGFVQALTVDSLDEDGDIGEIIETIKYYFKEEDTRVFIIDNDSLLSDTSKNFSDERREMDSIYKKLQMVANKLDVLVIVCSQAFDIKDGNSVVKIDNSLKAIDYAKTQIVITRDGINVTKELLSVKKTMDNNGSLIENKMPESHKKIANNMVGTTVQDKEKVEA